MKPAASALIAVLALLACFSTPASELRVDGGTLTVGAEITTDRVTIGTLATLAGNGRITAITDVHGAVSPGVSIEDVAELRIDPNITFHTGSAFLCHALTDTGVDRIVTTGYCLGMCQVVVSRSPGAIPVGQIVIKKWSAEGFENFTLVGPLAAEFELWDKDIQLELTDLVGDSDHDTLPDWWELKYCGARNGWARPGHNQDGDGMDDDEEYVAGTDPGDRSSELSITEIEETDPSTVSLTWNSVSNRVYTVEMSEGLTQADAGFFPIDLDIPGTPPRNTRIVEKSTATQTANYRVRVKRP